MTNKSNAEELLDKYRKGLCTEQEKAIVESWHLQELAGKTYEPTQAELLKADKELRHILSLPAAQGKPRKLWALISIAASILLILSVGAYLFINKNQLQQIQQPLQVTQNKPVAEPKRAVLTLANGAAIVLDHTKAGMLARQGSATIHQTQQGALLYKAQTETTTEAPLLYNTIATKKCAVYDLVLADGTKVWLNSSSSLSFPAEFSGKERNVKLTGEAYFEVAKNKEKPFIVEANGTKVQVLGTHFNIGAYADEPAVVTTLLEGSVKVSKNDKEALIVPGQQALSWAHSGNISLATANMDEVMAWHNGYFKFHNEDVKSIFRKVSRWYDIEVEYRGDLSDQRFGGTYSRSKTIGELLAHLEKIGNIHFKIEGRRIIVMA